MKRKMSYFTICYTVLTLLVPVKSQSINNSATIANQSGAPGDTHVVVTVSLSNTVPVSQFRFEIKFDAEILVATSAELTSRTEDFELYGMVGTEGRLYFEVVVPSGQSLESDSGPVANIFFNVDSSSQPGTLTLISFVPDSCMVLDTLGVPLPSLMLVNGIFTVVSVGLDDIRSLQASGLTEYIHIYPNPFRDLTAIQYTLSDSNQKSHLSLNIFDTMGRCVAALTEYTIEGNSCIFRWNGTNFEGNRLPSGVYICRLHSFSVPDGFYNPDGFYKKGNRVILLR